MSEIRFPITPSGVRRGMIVSMSVLFVLHLAGRFVRFVLGYDRALGFVGMFNLNAEANVPTLYSGLTLFAAGVLCLIVGFARIRLRQPLALYWFGMTAALFFAALDETLAIHEILSEILKSKFHTSGYLRYAWTAPYAVACAVGAVAGLHFLKQLPRSLQVTLVSSAALFVFSAAGLEAWSGKVAETYGIMSFYYLSLGTIEEMLEMVAVMIFSVGILRYIEAEYGPMSLVIALPSAGTKNSE